MSDRREHPDEEHEARCRIAASECTAFTLRKAARAIARIYDESMAPAGLRGTQFSLLIALSMAEEMPVQTLADHLALDRTTLTRNLAPLERDGLIESAPGTDRRLRLVRLSPRGRRALVKALPLWEEAQRRVVRGLGRPGWRQLIEGLRAAATLPASG
jgi:DNA-binding MarR family transcriptional regulator